MGKTSTNFLLISLILVIIYIIMLILKDKKIISTTLHKKILNVALLISFIPVLYSALSSIFWRDYGISFPYIFNHIFFGIIMIWLGIFHFFERLWFFKLMIKFNKKEVIKNTTPEIK